MAGVATSAVAAVVTAASKVVRKIREPVRMVSAFIMFERNAPSHPN